MSASSTESGTDTYNNLYVYVLRNTVHDNTGKLPFELFMERKLLTQFLRLAFWKKKKHLSERKKDDIDILVKELIPANIRKNALFNKILPAAEERSRNSCWTKSVGRNPCVELSRKRSH